MMIEGRAAELALADHGNRQRPDDDERLGVVGITSGCLACGLRRDLGGGLGRARAGLKTGNKPLWHVKRASGFGGQLEPCQPRTQPRIDGHFEDRAAYMLHDQVRPFCCKSPSDRSLAQLGMVVRRDRRGIAQAAESSASLIGALDHPAGPRPETVSTLTHGNPARTGWSRRSLVTRCT